MGLLRPKAKGDKYEREVAKYLDEILYDEEFQKILRAPLSGGGRSFQGGGSADITGTPDIWVEAKRNRMETKESLVVMRAEDWVKLYKAYLIQKGHKIKDD